MGHIHAAAMAEYAKDALETDCRGNGGKSLWLKVATSTGTYSDTQIGR